MPRLGAAHALPNLALLCRFFRGRERACRSATCAHRLRAAEAPRVKTPRESGYSERARNAGPVANARPSAWNALRDGSGSTRLARARRCTSSPSPGKGRQQSRLGDADLHACSQRAAQQDHPDLRLLARRRDSGGRSPLARSLGRTQRRPLTHATNLLGLVYADAAGETTTRVRSRVPLRRSCSFDPCLCARDLAA